MRDPNQIIISIVVLSQEVSHLRVEDLMIPGERMWNEIIIDYIFSTSDVDIVLKVPMINSI